MKLIKISPEWILCELPHLKIQVMKGIVQYHLYSSLDAHWFKLALTSQGIRFKESVYVTDERYQRVLLEFNINDIKETCPTLYEIFVAIDTSTILKGKASIIKCLFKN
jgi:hypothetical protein